MKGTLPFHLRYGVYWFCGVGWLFGRNVCRYGVWGLYHPRVLFIASPDQTFAVLITGKLLEG
jgi:hypothetical protein